MINDMFHTCKYCKHFNNGICINDAFDPLLTETVYQVGEDGGLAEVIEETLNQDTAEDLLDEVEKLLTSYKMSGVRKKAVKQLILDMLPQHYNFELKDQLDANISRLYQERLENATVISEVKIKEPNNFYCSRWE